MAESPGTPKASGTRPSIMSGIYRKVSLSLGRSKDDPKAKAESKAESKAAGKDTDDARDSFATPTGGSPSKQQPWGSGSGSGSGPPSAAPSPASTASRPSFSFPVVDDAEGGEQRSKSRTHARSISQQVDMYDWNAGGGGGGGRSPTPSDGDTDSAHSDGGSERGPGERAYPAKEGRVSKWTNYVTGWQDRWLVLRNGYLSYFRSKNEETICRGTVELAIAFVQKHEFDDLRLDVQFVDQFYYLRSPTKQDRDAWYDAIMRTQILSEASSGIHKSSSMASLTSMTSTNSTGSGLTIGSGGSIRTSAFTDKLSEVKTYRSLVNSLVEKMQAAEKLQAGQSAADGQGTIEPDVLGDRDSGAAVDAGPSDDNGSGSGSEAAPPPRRSLGPSQLRADLLMMKSTTSGMLGALEEAIEMAERREHEWRRRLKRANEKKAKFESLFRIAQEAAKQTAARSGPDMQEGPHSLLTEEAWFDALDSAETQAQATADTPTKPAAPVAAVPSAATAAGGQVLVEVAVAAAPARAKGKWELVAEKSLKASMMMRDELAASNVFEVVTKDAGMTVSRADGELDGIPIDRNRTQAVFQGITAKELCSYFADTKVKMDWEVAVESCRLLEELPELSASLYTLNMKRVWPSAARNCVLLSQTVQLGPGEWLCHTDSIDHPQIPKGGDDMVRVAVQSSVFAKTVVRPGVVGDPTRADISCELDYYALVNPGGWAPPSVVSAVSRREFPKTLRSLETNSTKYFKSKPLDNP